MASEPTVLKTSCNLLITGIRASIVRTAAGELLSGKFTDGRRSLGTAAAGEEDYARVVALDIVAAKKAD